MPSEKEIKIIQQAVIYELRRLIKKSGKNYTNEELCDLLDTIAEAKDQNKRRPPAGRPFYVSVFTLQASAPRLLRRKRYLRKDILTGHRNF